MTVSGALTTRLRRGLASVANASTLSSSCSIWTLCYSCSSRFWAPPPHIWSYSYSQSLCSGVAALELEQPFAFPSLYWLSGF